MRKGRLFILILVAGMLAFMIYYSVSHYSGEVRTLSGSVVLNEVMTSNKGSVLDEYGEDPDWVEIYNPTREPVSISGYGLSDDLLAGAKYVFPAGTTIPAEGCVVVFCSGEPKDAYHAPFKLSATEDLILYDTSGNAVDSIQLTAADAGHSLSRQGDGAWVSMRPSPGHLNTEEGIAAYEASLQGGADIGVYISEFMASNKTTIADEYGVFSDWIELYNTTDKAVDLSGMGISDNISQPSKHRFPEGTLIEAGGYLLIFCSGNQSGAGAEELHVPFGLRAYGEDVVLSDKRGHILDSVSFSNMDADVSMVRTQSGTFERSTRSTPGHPNTDEGYAAFTQQLSAQVGNVYISEMMGANNASYAAGDGGFYDWVELHNRGSAAVTLKGYGLSDNPSNPAKWVFPDVTMEPGEYMVLFASGESNAQSESVQKKNIQLSFRVAASGETVYLFSPDGIFLDKLSLSTVQTGVSCGRSDTLQPRYYAQPSPGEPNTGGMEGVTQTPELSQLPGIYQDAVTLSLTAGEGETIHYTLDATTPTASSTPYTQPITVSKNTVVRAVSVRNGYITGAVRSGTYLFTSDGVNHQLPIATLVTDPDNLWDSKTGIYAFGDRYDSSLPYGEAMQTANYFEGRESDSLAWEKPGSFSVFDDAGQEVFAQNIGMRIAGAFGRGRAQKGFNIIARDEYGPDRMQYPFFETRPFTEYKALVLRAGGQDQNRSKIRDELATGILVGSDVRFLYQAYKPYVLYLNGEYWGVYFLKEKRNRFFVAQHEGTENVTQMNIGKASSRVSYGTKDEWVELTNYINTHDLSVQANYDYVASQMDVYSFMDYMVCELYTGNSDYANIQYYKLPGGKWTWIYYDFCWGFSNYNHQTVTLRRGSVPAASGVFNALLKNSKWKDEFARRFGELMQTVFSDARLNALIDELYAQVEPEMQREREKFNSATFMNVKQHSEVLGTYDSFVRQVDYLREFVQKRPAVIKAQLKSELGLSDAYMREVFGE